MVQDRRGGAALLRLRAAQARTGRSKRPDLPREVETERPERVAHQRAGSAGASRMATMKTGRLKARPQSRWPRALSNHPEVTLSSGLRNLRSKHSCTTYPRGTSLSKVEIFMLNVFDSGLNAADPAPFGLRTPPPTCQATARTETSAGPSSALAEGVGPHLRPSCPHGELRIQPVVPHHTPGKYIQISISKDADCSASSTVEPSNEHSTHSSTYTRYTSCHDCIRCRKRSTTTLTTGTSTI